MKVYFLVALKATSLACYVVYNHQKRIEGLGKALKSLIFYVAVAVHGEGEGYPVHAIIFSSKASVDELIYN